ncbi:MAG: 8-oxo-dGTP pyrophosphatase MutT (NUDIX family) [Gammaproteobacteria bacterium]
MHRNQLLRLLTNYAEKNPSEKPCADQITEFIVQYDTCFNRELLIGHMTGSAWIVNRAGTHTLLTHHKKLNKWLQLGGHADGDSDILQVAKREADEESGLNGLTIEDGQIFDIDIHQIPARANEPQHLHHDIRFIFRAMESEDIIVSEESHDLSWVEISHLEDYNAEESMMRMARKWLHRPNKRFA